MQVTRLADGLWRWTALHPDWKPGDGRPDGWEQEVSCVYLEAPDHVVLVDPLVPGDERGRFFEAPTQADLEAVYEEIGSQVSTENEERELTAIFAAAGAVFLLLGGSLSALWFGRIP